MADPDHDGWWFRISNMMLADARQYRRVRKLTETDHIAAQERVGKDESIRLKAMQVGLQVLQRHLEAEGDRRKSIEEKARANLAAITIALTIIVAGPASLVALARTPPEWGIGSIPIPALLAIAALYFVWAGHMALKALLLRQWWQLAPAEELWDEEKRAEHTWWYVLMNKKVTLEKTNALDVSYTGMKCGMATLVVVVVALAVSATFGSVHTQKVSGASHAATTAVAADGTRRGADSMTLFPGSTWTDLATAAVACVSIAGVWWTFWPGHRERLRKRREKRLQRLLGLHVQLQHIGHWAGNSYDDDVHRPEWYNASWSVNPFPWDYVENFNLLVVARDYPRALTRALVTLEAAARRFHDMLTDQTKFLTRAPKDIGSRWPAAVAACEGKGGELTTQDLGGISNLTEEDRRWLADLYRRNKAIHVEGIGHHGREGLHEAWKAATSRLNETRAALQAGRDSRWRWVGHVLAGIFASLGLLFLVDFGWSFLALHRASTVTQTAARAKADSVRLSTPPDTGVRALAPKTK